MLESLKTEQLAIDGGTPVRTAPLAPWPSFTEEEVAAVAAVLRSGKVNYWTGEEVRSFEREYAAYCGRRFAVALPNGTLALELALRVAGIGAGDDVIVPARTFIASASCAVMCGARPVIADVERDSGNLSAATVERALTPGTRAIVAVHLAGWPVDMDPLLELARARRICVVEDCAQANGASCRGRPVGSFGDLAAFSFCQDKIITTGGEGGMLLLDREDWWRAAWSFKDHGKDYDETHRRNDGPGFRWLHAGFGTNWRMTEFQAALGRMQLKRLDASVRARQRHAMRLAGALGALPGLRAPLAPAAAGHAYYKFYAYVVPEALAPGWNRDRVLAAINAEGIPCIAGSCSEIYREQAFVSAGLGPAAPLPAAAELGETSLMFMVHPTLTDTDIGDTAAAVAKVMRAAAHSRTRASRA